MTVLNRLFPAQFDNRYRGPKVALWLLYPITFVNVGIDMVAIFTSDGGAQSADGIPLDTYGPAGARAVISVVADLGLADLTLGLFSILALVRYRSMIPLIYLFFVAESLAHRAINVLKPVERAGDAHGGVVTLVLFAVTVLGFLFSLIGRDTPSDPVAAPA